jgi:ABC-2 type transport system ATP-binding protein
MFRLFSEDAIDGVFNLFLIDVDTAIDANTTWFLPRGILIFLLLLRWSTMISLTWGIISGFKTHRYITMILGTVGVLTALLNIVFFQSHLYAFFGEEVGFFNLRSIEFFIETVIFALIMGLSLYQLIINKINIHLREIWKPIIIFLGSAFFIMPEGILYNFFGNYGEVPDDFNGPHIFVIFIAIALMFIVYFILRHKKQNTKDLLIIFLTFAAFFQYFYVRRTGLSALPLHLCNTAVILLLVSVVFKIKGMFYFSYFANVLGAIGAILLPNYSSDLFNLSVIHFGYNHLYALIIPILAVALHMFSRPVLSHMLKAIGIFSIYFIIVVNLNAWFNNYGDTDYFFTYSDFLSDMFGARNLQYSHIVEFNFKGLTFTYFWLYQVLFYIIFIFIMFVSWFVYDASYQMVDQHHRLKMKQKQMRVDHLNLMELLDGRSITEPMNPGGKDMIKISHFSKRYGHDSKYAVKDFSLEVKRGEIFGFLGHNGAGKSTTIKSLVGIQSITEGEMEICGYSIKSQPLEAKLRMGYVSDNHAVYEKLTGREYIHYVADLYRVPSDLRDKRLEELAETLNLSHAIDQMIKSYSHGMKQKIVVIASLIHEPTVWILDEPLTGLDPISSYQIKEIMKNHAAKGNIVFFSSHVIEVVEKVCTKIAVITQGELTGIYEMDALKKKGISLEELYMKDIKKLTGVSHV